MPKPPVPSLLDKALASSGWVRRLALSLARDDSSASDLVQETWSAALASPPASDAAYRSWIRSVMKNRAGLAWRSEKRRETRERAAARSEAVPSSAAMIERVELQGHVTKAVLSLREPYRSVVLLRFFENMTPEQIAQHLKIPSSSVRTQLQRSMAQLREKLDANYGQDRSSWSCIALATIPSDAAVASTIAGATATSTGVAATNPLSQFMAWIFIMTLKKSSVISAAVLLIAGCIVVPWLLKTDEKTESSAIPALATEVTVPSGDSRPDETQSPIVTTGFEENQVVPEASSTAPMKPGIDKSARMARVRGRVVAKGRGPVTDGRIFLWGYDEAGSSLNDDGEFLIETNGEHARGLFYSLDGARMALAQEVRPSFDRETEVLVEVDPGYTVMGKVISAATRAALPGVRMTLRATSRDSQVQAQAVFFSSAEEGAFQIPLIPKGVYSLELVLDGYTPTTLPLEIPRQASFTAEMEAARPFALTFSNWDDWKHHKRVTLQMFRQAPPAPPGGSPKKTLPTESAWLSGQPDEDGDLVLAAPRAGKWTYDLFSGSGFPRQRGVVTIPEGTETVPLSIHLPKVGKTVIEGRVLDGAGQPVTEGNISVQRSHAEIQSDGSFRLTKISPGVHTVSLSFGKTHNRRVVYNLGQWDIPDEAFVSRDLQLRGTAIINVKLTDVPLALRNEDPIIRLNRDGDPRHLHSWSVSHPDKPTSFRFLPTGIYTISPQFHGHARLKPRKVEVLHEGQVVNVSFKMETRIATTVQILVPGGTQLPKQVTLVSPPSGATNEKDQIRHELTTAKVKSTISVADSGIFDTQAFPVGKHQVELRAPGFRTQVFELTVGSTSRSVPTLMLELR